MKTYLLTFLTFFSFIAAHAQGTLLRGPYLQVATPTSIIIRWRTDQPSNSMVKVGSSSQSLDKTFTDNAATTEHEVKVTGLQAETRYYYSIGSQTAVLQTGDHNFFQTAAVAGKPGKYRFGLLGDCGTNSVIQDDVRARLMEYLGGNYMNAWLLLGDNAYSFGRDAEYQSNFFNRYKDNLLKQYPLFPSPGNHDYDNDNPARQDDHKIPYYDVFTMPTQGEAGGEPSGTESFYSFDYGNVHFLSLDSYGREDNATRLYDTLGKQVQWIKKDLAANQNKDWVVAYWHHPPYSKGSRESDGDPEMAAIRQNFIRILERMGVDLIVCGHSHVYERSRLMGGHYGNSSTFDASKHVVDLSSARYDGSDNSCPYIKNSPQSRGTVYVVAGSGGQLGNPKPDFPHKAMYHSDAEHGGSLMLEVEGNRLDLKWIAADGVIRDKFTMEKGVNKETTHEIARNQSVELKASFVGDYVWTDGSKNRTLTVQPAQSTDYTVKDAQNCIQDVFHVKVTTPKPDPAKLISLTTERDNKNSVTVKWTSETEAELSHYSVQRSDDARNFAEIGKVTGGPNSQQRKDYVFVDTQSQSLPVNDTYYYRLAMNALDGRIIYSRIVAIVLPDPVLAAEPNISLDIEIIPNPSSASQMQIRTTGQTTQMAELTLTDVSGRTLDNRKLTISQTPAAFLPSQLTTGIYFLKVSINGRSAVKKLAIQ
ncbi:Por secretion system C-terminal sorting domain-containing protein [Dyadobacter soli]|uniref:Por secretion system C-terminal sorting domain-containing protein n=1 Tax=Dyadobacter soli TaxID=659014 RepID=A0A1G8ALF3_9BACT|nr:metallophosphoesterase [Dyadobacter soli]SDH21747.1 Por secretion system C-terminal sorting domain-containing protein [Dyadobacter soli]